MRPTEKIADRLAAALAECGMDAHRPAGSPGAVVLELDGRDYCIMAERTHLRINSPCGGRNVRACFQRPRDIDESFARMVADICIDMAEDSDERADAKRNHAFDIAFDAVRDHVGMAYPDEDVEVDQSEDGTIIRIRAKSADRKSDHAGAIVLGRTLGSVPRTELKGFVNFKPMPSAGLLGAEDLAATCTGFADSVLYDCRKVENAVARYHRRGGRLESVPEVGHYVQMDGQAHCA